MKTAVLSLSLFTAALLPLAAQAQQAIVPAQSEVSFVSRQMGVPVEGRFKSFSAQVAFDPAKLATSKIAFSVDTGSADISREANAELVKPLWFNVAAFPKATFQSTAIKRLDATKYEVSGQLSIKGLSSNVVVPVTLAQNGATTTATGNSVVMKPSEKSPLTALRLAEIAVEAGLPPGVFNVVPGFGHEAGEALALHMEVDAIGFTGSTRTGCCAEIAGMRRSWARCWAGGRRPWPLRRRPTPRSGNTILRAVSNRCHRMSMWPGTGLWRRGLNRRSRTMVHIS